jgi:tetraacyldisaccharide 4'-kinase
VAKTTPERVERPVICIGNVTLGGAGKTPLTRTLRERLTARGLKVATLSRGHGGALKGPTLVDPARHSAADVGDEPLLHAADGLAVIARDRVAGARTAIAADADIVVMDDGFQNPMLHKDVSILVFDEGFGVGNGRLVPAGPLREALSDGLSRADAVVVMRTAPAPGARPDYLDGFKKPILDAWLEPTIAAPPGRLLAFAGIARPDKFFHTLEQIGATLVDGASYPDHHVFSEGELNWLAKLADDREARLITTEKDAVRLPAAWRAKILTLPVRARLADPAALDGLLQRVFARA